MPWLLRARLTHTAAPWGSHDGRRDNTDPHGDAVPPVQTTNIKPPQKVPFGARLDKSDRLVVFKRYNLMLGRIPGGANRRVQQQFQAGRIRSRARTPELHGRLEGAGDPRLVSEGQTGNIRVPTILAGLAGRIDPVRPAPAPRNARRTMPTGRAPLKSKVGNTDLRHTLVPPVRRLRSQQSGGTLGCAPDHRPVATFFGGVSNVGLLFMKRRGVPPAQAVPATPIFSAPSPFRLCCFVDCWFFAVGELRGASAIVASAPRRPLCVRNDPRFAGKPLPTG